MNKTHPKKIKWKRISKKKKTDLSRILNLEDYARYLSLGWTDTFYDYHRLCSSSVQHNNFDRYLKWGAILEAIQVLTSKKTPDDGSKFAGLNGNFTDMWVCDAGCGDSPMAAIMGHLGAEYAVGVTTIPCVQDVPGTFKKQGEVEYINHDFIDFIQNETEDEEFDLVVDCCAMHTFLFDGDTGVPKRGPGLTYGGGGAAELSYIKSSKGIFRSLSPGGVFITATDISDPLCPGMMPPTSIINIFQDTGFKLVGEWTCSKPYHVIDWSDDSQWIRAGIQRNARAIRNSHSVARLVFRKPQKR